MGLAPSLNQNTGIGDLVQAAPQAPALWTRGSPVIPLRTPLIFPSGEDMV